MSKVRLTGSTSGYTELTAPASAGNNTLVLPSGNGSNGQILGTDGAGNLSWVGGRMVLETAKASTSGTSVDFTGIPSWVKRVTVMFDKVGTNGVSPFLVQLGTSSGFTASGYASRAYGVTTNTTASSIGFLLNDNSLASGIYYGAIPINSITGNTFVYSGLLTDTSNPGGASARVGGGVVLSNSLDRLRITTVNGTDTFDEGTINLLLEG
jgi:hypothetical protein